jgi:hypothetical protein
MVMNVSFSRFLDYLPRGNVLQGRNPLQSPSFYESLVPEPAGTGQSTQ